MTKTKNARVQSLMDYQMLQQIAENCLLSGLHTTELANELRRVALRLRCEAELTDVELGAGKVLPRDDRMGANG